jgi:hypothetical protein
MKGTASLVTATLIQTSRATLYEYEHKLCQSRNVRSTRDERAGLEFDGAPLWSKASTGLVLKLQPSSLHRNHLKIMSLK